MRVHPPRLAAALHAAGLLPTEDLPLLVAHWVAAGEGGEHAVDLAGRGRRDRDVGELWPLALAEVGVALPLRHARRALVTEVAGPVVRGEQPARWLVRLLWPPAWEDDPDPELDDVIWVVHDVQEWAVPLTVAPTGPTGAEEHCSHAELAVRQVGVALGALAVGDVPAAHAALAAPG